MTLNRRTLFLRVRCALLLVVAVLTVGACASSDRPAVTATNNEDPIVEPEPVIDSESEIEGKEATAATDEVVVPTFEIAQRKDVSYDFGPGDAAQRLALRVEIPEWPVTKEQLQALAEGLIEIERGHGWQAISIAMGADRDETVPAYGTFDWAPFGDWERASEGDAKTWANYDFSVDWGAKMSNPEEADCVKPPPLAFQYNKELWAAGMAKSEKQIIRDIAVRHDDTPAHVDKLLRDVLEWEFC